MMSYQYCNCSEGESQYDSVDLKQHKPVDARYIPARLEADRGNRYIEALPPPIPSDKIKNAYTKTVPGYSREKVKTMSDYDKMLEVGLMRKMRIVLPAQKEFDLFFYNSLLTRYRDADKQDVTEQKVTYISMNREMKSSSRLLGNPAASTNASCSYTGHSGSGKSSTAEITLSHYPQYILHRDEDGGHFPQITYLVVDCLPNNNFHGLYRGIGHALDLALGNTQPVYEAELSKNERLENKLWKVVKYIETFSIGAIIFDEIQLMDFEHTKENSFNTLMDLSNITKVAIIAIGTEEATKKMFTKLQNSRRLGVQINASSYCSHKDYFDSMVDEVFNYQWFDKWIDVTENYEIKDALYDVTKGLVDQLIGIYICMHYEYIRRKKKPKIDGKFIRRVADKYYPGMQEVLENIDMQGMEAKRRELISNNEVMLQAMLDEESQKEAEKEILESKDDMNNEQFMLHQITENLKSMGFTYEETETAFQKVWCRKGSEDLSESDLTKKVARLLLEQEQGGVQSGNKDDSQKKTEKKRRAPKNTFPKVDPSEFGSQVLGGGREDNDDNTDSEKAAS